MARKRVDICSVIIPTHNRRRRLLPTLATVLSQSYEHLEIVVSDDGSSDDTFEFLSKHPDSRVKVVRTEPAAGVANARNVGVAASSGRWVAFCDDDDLWLPDKIKMQIDCMEEKPARWTYCGAVIVSDDLDLLGVTSGPNGEEFPEFLEFGNKMPGGCSNAVVERSLFDEVGGFDPNLSMIADWDLWLRMTAIAPVANLQKLGLLYVQHQNQMSLDMSNMNQELAHFRSKHAERRASLPRPRIEGIDMWVARRLWMSGQHLSALRHASQTWRPRSLARSLESTVFGFAADQSDDPEVTADALAAIHQVQETIKSCSSNR